MTTPTFEAMGHMYDTPGVRTCSVHPFHEDRGWVDSRHGLKPVDREVMQMLDDAAVSYHLVLTKADKIKPTVLAATLEEVRQEAAKRPAAHPTIFATSSETGAGIAELRTSILDAATS